MKGARDTDAAAHLPASDVSPLHEGAPMDERDDVEAVDASGAPTLPAPPMPQPLDHAGDIAVTEDVIVLRCRETGELFAISGKLFEVLAAERDAAFAMHVAAELRADLDAEKH